MTVCGVSVLKTVVFVFTLNPRDLASLIAATASSNTPSLQTDSSCRSRSPSMCTTQAKYGDGLNLSSFFGSSSALVQRKTNFLRLISSETITSIWGGISGSPAAEGTHGGAPPLHGADRLLDRHPLLEDGVRLLDLPAAGALQVAGEQRLELDEQRELLIASQLLAHQVGPDAQRLTQWHRHYPRTSLGRPNLIDSVVVTRSETDRGPSPESAEMISSTTAGGAEAPAVRPIVDTPVSQPSWMSAALSIRCAGVPARSQVSTSRTELEEFAEPATSTRSESAATARTAACRLVVA